MEENCILHDPCWLRRPHLIYFYRPRFHPYVGYHPMSPYFNIWSIDPWRKWMIFIIWATKHLVKWMPAAINIHCAARCYSLSSRITQLYHSSCFSVKRITFQRGRKCRPNRYINNRRRWYRGLKNYPGTERTTFGQRIPLKKVYRFLELNTTVYQRVCVNRIFQDVCDLGLPGPQGGSSRL